MGQTALLLPALIGIMAAGMLPAAPADADFFAGFAFDSKAQTVWTPVIAVASPGNCAEIQGDVNVRFSAPGMSVVKARCWQQPTSADPDPRGHDADPAPDLKLDAAGNGSFVFHADRFPNGPITLRLYAKDDGNRQDYYELQLFNKGGTVWNQGLPRSDPPAAKGMKPAFADDFDGPLSISPDGTGARYMAHKTGGGDFSTLPFIDPRGENEPFGRAGTFLRIHAAQKPGTAGSTGIISSLHADGGGFHATAPCYFECRFIAHNVPGAWPAFWTCSKTKEFWLTNRGTCDELDVIEAYGTNGKSGGIWTAYHVTSHFWAQPEPAWLRNKELGPDGKPYQLHRLVDPMELGGRSSWSMTFHNYGLLITKKDTVYFFDDIEVLRHPSGELSTSAPTWFHVNYAFGSGWKIDLTRHGDQSDMWVDWVRVYQGNE